MPASTALYVCPPPIYSNEQRDEDADDQLEYAKMPLLMIRKQRYTMMCYCSPLKPR